MGQVLTIKTTKDKKDKYGRYLVTIMLDNSLGDLKTVNEVLLSEGLAVNYQP